MSTESLQVMSQYSTNLTDKQWQVTEKIFDPHHRKRKYRFLLLQQVET